MDWITTDTAGHEEMDGHKVSLDDGRRIYTRELAFDTQSNISNYCRFKFHLNVSLH